jgi:hypothetical protein
MNGSKVESKKRSENLRKLLPAWDSEQSRANTSQPAKLKLSIDRPLASGAEIVKLRTRCSWLTPLSRVLRKLVVAQLVKFLAFQESNG